MKEVNAVFIREGCASWGYRVHDTRYFDPHDFSHLGPACWWFYFIWQKDFVDVMKVNN